MDIFESFVGQKALVTYFDGKQSEEWIYPTNPKNPHCDQFPYYFKPGRPKNNVLQTSEDPGTLYSTTGDCYLGGARNVQAIQPIKLDILKPFINQLVVIHFSHGKTQVCKVVQHVDKKYPYILMIQEGNTPVIRCTEEGNCEDGKKIECVFPFTTEPPKAPQDPNHHKKILSELAEILVSSNPDDDPSDLVEEIREHMRNHCQDIMEKAEAKQDDKVEELKNQIANLDSAAYTKLLEQLHLTRI